MQNESLSCPFCCYETAKVDDLQGHVTTEHSDELRTPTKSPSSSSYPEGTTTDEVSECPVCHEQLPFNEIESHVSTHFLDNEETGCSSSDALLAMEMQFDECAEDDALAKQQAEDLQLKVLQQEFNLDPDDKVTYKKQASRMLEKAVGRKKLTASEYYQKRFEMLESLEQGIDDGSTFTADLAANLCKICNQQSKPSFQWVLSMATVHYGRGAGDSGWGCGFRNLQMILSSLTRLPQYQKHLQQFKDGIPSIPKIQQMIECAWNCGFDPNGRDQLMGKLSGTRKWIGATEAFVLLSSLRLQCRIIDFESRSEKLVNKQLSNWISNYFSKTPSKSQKQGCAKLVEIPLLYLQHHGHSRSVCGVQFDVKSNGVTHLVMCDPGTTRQQLTTAISQGKRATFAKTLNSFKEEKYQIVAVAGIANEEQYQKQKDVDAVAEKIYS